MLGRCVYCDPASGHRLSLCPQQAKMLLVEDIFRVGGGGTSRPVLSLLYWFSCRDRSAKAFLAIPNKHWYRRPFFAGEGAFSLSPTSQNAIGVGDLFLRGGRVQACFVLIILFFGQGSVGQGTNPRSPTHSAFSGKAFTATFFTTIFVRTVCRACVGMPPGTPLVKTLRRGNMWECCGMRIPPLSSTSPPPSPPPPSAPAAPTRCHRAFVFLSLQDG